MSNDHQDWLDDEIISQHMGEEKEEEVDEDLEEKLRETMSGKEKKEEYSDVVKEEVTYSKVEFEEFSSEGNVREEPKGFEFLYDIPVPIRVVLGKVKKTVEEILSYDVGSIIPLEKLAGEHVDVYAAEELIAKGEIVIINENFGVRITEIISPKERLNMFKNNIKTQKQ